MLKKKILFLGYQDFANVSSDIAAALNAHSNWEAKVVCAAPHPFNYSIPHDLDYDFSSAKEHKIMQEWVVSGVDVIVWAEECSTPGNYYSYYHENRVFKDTMFFNTLQKQAKKIIFHAGVGYRAHFDYYNAMDLKHFDAQLTSPDLFRLSPKATPLFGKPMPVDLNHVAHLWNDVRPKHKIVITHSPTNYHLKGTTTIMRAVERLKIKFPYKKIVYQQIGGPAHQQQSLSNPELATQRNAAHVYIDQYSPLIGGIGMSSLEAMAAGMLVFCTACMISPSAWIACGIDPTKLPLRVLPTPTPDQKVNIERLVETLSPLCEMSFAEMKHEGMQSALWTEAHLTPKIFAAKFQHIVDSFRF
jgi:hypothetical protein